MVEQGADISSDTMLTAVESVFFSEEKVRLLLSHNCPYDARALKAASSRNLLHILNGDSHIQSD